MTNKLGNTNYQAIMAQATADMQRLQNISSGSDWEQILSVLQGNMQNYIPGAGKSVFNIAESGEALVNGGAEQKAAAFQNILNNIVDLLGNLGMKENVKANQEVKKNNSEIDKNEQEASKLHQTVDAKLQEIMNECTNGAKTIEDALKEIEALGGDKGQIATAQQDLEEQLKIIEENKVILNNGVSNSEEKKKALVNILNAASAINALVALVNGYKEKIEEQNAIVETTANDLSDLTTDAYNTLESGMNDMGNLLQQGQNQAVKTETLGTEGTVYTGTGETQVVIGEGLTDTVYASSEGVKYIMSGNDKINAGATLMGGSIQGIAKSTQSLGEMGSYLQYFANFCNGIGKFADGTQELLGQYDATINPSIEAIGSWQQVESANGELQSYLQEYTSDIGTSDNSSKQGNWGQTFNVGIQNGKPSYNMTNNLQDKQTEIENSDSEQMNFKEFMFDTNLFKSAK